jgi:hypothetical protein
MLNGTISLLPRTPSWPPQGILCLNLIQQLPGITERLTKNVTQDMRAPSKIWAPDHLTRHRTVNHSAAIFGNWRYQNTKITIFKLHGVNKNSQLYAFVEHWTVRFLQRLAMGWKVRRSNTVGGDIFRIRPGRPGYPSSLLLNGYRVSFPGVKRPGHGVDHPHPSSAEVKERVELYLYSSSGPSWPVLRRTLPLPLPVVCSGPD